MNLGANIKFICDRGGLFKNSGSVQGRYEIGYQLNPLNHITSVHLNEIISINVFLPPILFKLQIFSPYQDIGLSKR